jgi:hypothetical protein
MGVAVCAMFAVTLTPVSAQLANATANTKDAAPKGKGKAKGPVGGPTPRIGMVTINQPDFGGPGSWDIPYITNMSQYIIEGGKEPCETFPSDSGAMTQSCAPFNAKGREYFALRRKYDSATDPEGFCLPPGIPRMMYTPYPMKMIQEPNMITFIFEGGAHVWRQVPVAPRGFLRHAPDPNPTYLGDAIGWWEDDTLVVETIGFNNRTWLDFAGHPHGEQLKVTERFKRIDTLNMEHTATIEDPEFYTQPWTVRINIPYNPTKQLLEYICQENEADTKHLLENLRKRGVDPDKIP